MLTRDKNFGTRGFSTPPATWKTAPPTPPAVPMSERKRMSPSDKDDLFHVVHKVPAGDSPYVRAKQVQLIEKDPGKAISLFWAAINAGDRVDSALKDMAVVMKQLDRAEEAIEAIKSFRHLCPYDSQESVNNVLVELYKRSGRIEEEIELLESKLKHIDEGIAFCGRRTKTARAQGRKVQITVEQERARILGNLAWAYLQKGDYKTAEEYYLKALSLEPDKNRQCNLAICLMHMNRFTEAKHLLQVVRDSSGNKPMDESYAKSFERAYQMLSELEAQSVLRPIQQDGRSYMFSRRRADGREEENLSVDQWKKDRYFKNLCESRSSFSSKMKDNQGGIVGAETTPNAKTYFSPAPAIWDPEVQFSQPRRSPWGFNGGHPRRELSFDRCPKTENVRAHAVRNINEDLPASTVGKSEVPVHNSVSSLSSPISRDLRRPQGGAAVRSVLQPISSGNWKGTSQASDGCFQPKDKATVVGSFQNTVNGDWRKGSWENGGIKKSAEPVHNSVSSLSSPISRDLRRPQGGAAVRSVLQPISSGNWKGTSRASDGCFQLKDKATVVGSFQNTVNGDWRKGSWENGGIKKSAEPQMAGENAKALDIVIDGGQNQSSDTTVLGSMEPIVVEGCFRENSSGEIDEVQQTVAENQKQGPDLSMYSCGKKSWADMAEEEEQELFNGSTEYYDFNNENLNCNIPSESPCLQTQMKSLGSKLESVDLKDKNVISGNAGSPRNSAVRRSLQFDQQQEQESVDYISSSSPVPKAGRRKRLQSFQDITEFQDSP